MHGRTTIKIGHMTICSYVILTLRMLSASPQLTKQAPSNAQFKHNHMPILIISDVTHTAPFYRQLIFPAGTRDFSLLHSIPTQPNSYSLGSFLVANTAGE
jgi:hypothetical protein